VPLTYLREQTLTRQFKHICATVPQGVGDIFWCYQKLKPHCETISFKIAVLNSACPVQGRAEKIILDLPGVTEVTLLKLNIKEYEQLIGARYSLDIILNNRADHIQTKYSVNHLLDNGVKLEALDALPVLYDVPLPLESMPDLPAGYAVFYVSGTTANVKAQRDLKLWTYAAWAHLIKKAGCPVVLTGSEFDAEVMRQIKKLCPEVTLVIQPEPAKLFYLLKNAAFFVGYQSGLSVLADNLGAKSLIVYFDKLPLMQDSWAHPARRETHFNWCYFSDGIEKAAAIMKARLCS